MVNANDMTSRLEKELAFTEKELAELERARKMPITSMRTARKLHRKKR